MGMVCTWCGTEHEAGVEGFCSEDCRQNFNAACRIWAAAEYEAERVSISSVDREVRSICPGPPAAGFSVAEPSVFGLLKGYIKLCREPPLSPRIHLDQLPERPRKAPPERTYQ